MGWRHMAVRCVILAAVVCMAGCREPVRTMKFAGASGGGRGVCGDDDGVGTAARFR